MKRFFELAGIDFLQWRSLMRAYMAMDYAALLGAYGAGVALRAAVHMLIFWGFLTGCGIALGFLVWAARDPFFAALIVVTAIMFYSGFAVVSQPAALASPTDHEIVGPRPVTSRTYFAVRLTAVLLQVTETAVLLGWIPVVAFLTRDGGSLRLALAAAAGIAGGAVAATTGIVAIYGWLIQIVHPARLTRVVAQAGAALSLALSAGLAIGAQAMMQADRPFAFLDTALPRDLRTLWFPGAWFASYVAIGDGSAQAPELLAATASVVALLLFGTALRGRMSLDYAARIAELGTLTGPPGTPLRDRWLFRRSEARAVALLLSSHLRGDVRFQLALASEVVVALVMSLTAGGFRMPVDPFVATTHRMSGNAMPLMALIIVPIQVYRAIVTTASHEAAWLFFTTPADHTNGVIAGRDAIAVYVLVPLLCLVAAFHVYAYGNLAHALIQTTFLAAMAYLSLQCAVLLTPRLPFSVPLLDGRRSPFAFGPMLLVMAIALPLAFLLQWIAFQYRFGMVGVLALLALLIWVVNGLTRSRIAHLGVPSY